MNVLGLGVFMLVFGVKTGSIKVDDNLKKSVCGKNVKLCDHKSGCNDFLKKEIRMPAQNAVALPNLKLTCGRVLRQNEEKLVNNTGTSCLGELVALLESSSFTYTANVRFKLRISQNRK